MLSYVFVFLFMEKAMMDRDEQHNLPKMQIGFIDSICLPLYKVSFLQIKFKRKFVYAQL